MDATPYPLNPGNVTGRIDGIIWPLFHVNEKWLETHVIEYKNYAPKNLRKAEPFA